MGRLAPTAACGQADGVTIRSAPSGALLALALWLPPSAGIPQEGASGPGSSAGALYQAVAIERARAGLPGLSIAPELEQLADDWARHLAGIGKLVHRNDLRRIMGERGWWALTENLHFSSGPFDAAEVMARWLASRPHRKNVLDPDVTHVGIGTARDASGRSYTVFNAARLAPPPAEAPAPPPGGLVAPPGAVKPSPIPKG
jgi:uncharacterized protein YkwD